MGNKTLAEEYIISIIPELDEKKFEKARKKVKRIVSPSTSHRHTKTEEEKAAEKARKEQEEKQKKYNKELKFTANLINSTSRGSSSFVNTFGQMSEKVALIVASLATISKTFDKLTESAKSFSNSMITANSAFVNKNTRQLMATFGVSGETATGMSSVMNLMGIDTSDFAMMTPAQMQLYARLMQQWQEGMDSIDDSSLEKFQEVMQGFQSEFASAKLELQIQFYKMLVDLAPELEEFFTGITNLIRGLGELLNSPLVKTVLSALSNVVTTIANTLSGLSYVLSGDLGNAIKAFTGQSTSTTNNYTITTTSNNSYTGDTSSMYALATATQETATNSLLTTLNSTGGT